jgi:hypothetical protein
MIAIRIAPTVPTAPIAQTGACRQERVYMNRAGRVQIGMLDEVATRSEAAVRRDQAGLREMHAQLVWLEACGWTVGADGLCRHPQKAAGYGLLPAHAFAVEAGRHIDLRP